MRLQSSLQPRLPSLLLCPPTSGKKSKLRQVSLRCIPKAKVVWSFDSHLNNLFLSIPPTKKGNGVSGVEMAGEKTETSADNPNTEVKDQRPLHVYFLLAFHTNNYNWKRTKKKTKMQFSCWEISHGQIMSCLLMHHCCYYYYTVVYNKCILITQGSDVH